MNVPSLRTLGVVTVAALACAAAVPPTTLRLTPVSSIDAGGVKAAVTWLRARLRGERADLPASVQTHAGDRIPAVLAVWIKGERKHVWQEANSAFGDALVALGERLAALGDEGSAPSLRLELSIGIAEGRLPDGGIAATYALVQGRDGVKGTVGGRPVYVPPTELMRRGVYGSEEIFPGHDLQVKVGSSVPRLRQALKQSAKDYGMPEAPAAIMGRFRAVTIVEGEDLVPREIAGGTVERPPLTRAAAEASVRAGTDYLMGVLGKSGYFVYEWDPVEDRAGGSPYSWARHCGTAWSLALSGRILHEPSYLEGAARAIGTATARLVPASGNSRCLKDDYRCYFGSSALLLITVAEYRNATGDTRFDDVGRDLARFIRWMQRPNGLFYHFWNTDGSVDKGSMLPYASQQAVLALALWGRATGDAEAIAAAKKGMDYLAGPYWRFFLGKWFFFPEHWTCLAAEQLYAIEPKPEWAAICQEVGRHFARATMTDHDVLFPDHAGGLGILDILPPHEGGTATGGEAMATAVRIGRQSGADTAAIREALVRTYNFLYRCQATVHDSFWFKKPWKGVGGFYERQVATMVRIDNVQHATSAMIRGLDLLPDDGTPVGEAMKTFSGDRTKPPPPACGARRE